MCIIGTVVTEQQYLFRSSFFVSEVEIDALPAKNKKVEAKMEMKTKMKMKMKIEMKMKMKIRIGNVFLITIDYFFGVCL